MVRIMGGGNFEQVSKKEKVQIIACIINSNLEVKIRQQYTNEMNLF
jgi:hypothetical protein